MAIQWLTDAGGLAEPTEMDSTAKETWAADKVSCSVKLMCPWADRYNVLLNLMQYAPAWPYHDTPIAYAVNAEIENFPGKSTKNGSGLDYELATIAVGFESGVRKTGDDGKVTIFDESIEPTAEFLTLPPDSFRWGGSSGDKLKKEEAPGRLELGMDYCVTIYNMAAIPSAVLSLRGKSNDAPITSPTLGLAFDTETLLFNPPKITRKIAIGDTNLFTLQIRYTHKEAGWNKFWRANKTGGADYDTIYDTVAAADYKNFAPASFAGLVP